MKNKATKKPAALALAPIDRSTLSPAESRLIAAARGLDSDVLDFQTEAMERYAREYRRETISNRPGLKLVKGGLAS
jgi:hypothetical protein